jgi:enoyl-CoA hydratase/carnithine racemase
MDAHYNNIVVESEGPIRIVTLSKAERRNALSVALMQELIDCFHSIGANQEIRAVILSAEGPAFSAGHDLSELLDRGVEEYRQVFDVCCQLMAIIQQIPQPVIAEVKGIATAAGCQLVAACDLAVATEDASFATPGVRIGLFCTTPMVALTRAIGRKRALEMLLTGTPIDAATAVAWGLINRAVPATRIREESLALANQIAKASSLTVSIGKQAFYAQIELEQQKAYAYAKEIMSLNAMALDAQEGISAFLEKRTAHWQGK